MEILVIGILALLVVHAANKTAGLEQAATATQATPAPTNTMVSATGATPTPSPATAMGAPGAASMYGIKLNTNAPFVRTVGVGLVPLTPLPGVPLPQVSGRMFNGYNAVPAKTKQLSTNGMSRQTQAVATPPVPTASAGPVVIGDVDRNMYKM